MSGFEIERVCSNKSVILDCCRQTQVGPSTRSTAAICMDRAHKINPGNLSCMLVMATKVIPWGRRDVAEGFHLVHGTHCRSNRTFVLLIAFPALRSIVLHDSTGALEHWQACWRRRLRRAHGQTRARCRTCGAVKTWRRGIGDQLQDSVVHGTR